MKAVSGLVDVVLDNWKMLLLALVLLLISEWAVENYTGHGLSTGCGCITLDEPSTPTPDPGAAY